MKRDKKCPDAATFIEALEEKKIRQGPPKTSAATARKPELRDALLKMEKEDQALREQKIAGNANEQVDSRITSASARHLATIKSIAANQGFPTKDDVGPEGVDAFWLLVQHADADPAFQAEMLKVVSRRVDNNEIDRSKVCVAD